MAQQMFAELDDEGFRVLADRIPFHNREQVDYVSFAMKQLGPLLGRRVLEVGVGGGMLAVWMALQGADVTGIDVSEGILAVADKRARVSGVASRMRLIHCPVEELDLPDSHFDLVLGNNVVHHFDRAKALANVARLLRRQGRATFCEPVLLVPEVLRRIRYAGPVARRLPPHTHTPDERSLTREDLEMFECYFGTVRWKPFQLLCRLQNFVELSDATWNRLESIDRRVLSVVPAARWLTRMIVLTLDDPRKTTNRRLEPATEAEEVALP
jgi:2-polyprenyl-3-methyl-5-hydroxy-6-metoxy-1,4-benzoquinol methylase